jgi:hypothetical protein
MKTPGVIKTGGVTRHLNLVPKWAPATPVQSLWVAVIVRAIQDAVWFWGLKEEPARTHYRDATRWLFDPVCDHAFCQVCELAGMDPVWVRQVARGCLERRITDQTGLQGTTSHPPQALKFDRRDDLEAGTTPG